MSESGVATAALALAARGLRIIPIHGCCDGACTCGRPGCGSVGKHPRTEHGYKDGTINPEIVARWWRQWPNANLGIVTGSESGLLVLDIDPRHGGTDSLSGIEDEYGPLPETPEVQTGGGGRHIYFKHPGGTVSCDVGLQVDGGRRLGLDVRGDGGYIVAPPSIHASGRAYTWIRSLQDAPLAALPQWLLDSAAPIRRGSRQGLPESNPIPEGERNQTLFTMASTWRAAGDDEETILDRLRSVPCSTPLDDQEIGQIARSASKFPKAFHLTDFGNARRLIARHGRDLRYCKAWKFWLCWTGTHWSRDTTGEVERRATDTIISLYGDASRIQDDMERRALGAHLRRSESDHKVRAMVAMAASERVIAVTPEAFDSSPWLLNVENGTLDLRTALLREHRRDDLITRVAPVKYDPTASHPVLQAFLDRSVPNRGMQGYLQRGVGSSLTGITEDERLFFVHGPTSTGKSTFAEAVKAMLGPYAVTADFHAFLRKRDSGVPNDIARLAGARLVVSLEVEEGKQLAGALVKSLTGGDTITARFLHNEFFEFRPQFKLWLVANHKPKTDPEDAATWRRIRVIPFTESIAESERDDSVKRVLRDDPLARSALLAWAAKGCLDWQKGGLREPEAVRQATAQYRDECDPLSDFVAEACTIAPEAQVGVTDLYAAYGKWCVENGEKAMSQREFGRRLNNRDLEKPKRSTGGRYIRRGIGLSEPSDTSEPDAGISPYDSSQEEKPADGSLTSLGSLRTEAVDRAGMDALIPGLDG